MSRRFVVILVVIVVLSLAGIFLVRQSPTLLMKPITEERIAFVSDRGGQVDVWTMRMDGSDKRQVTNDPADDRSLAWSPEGTEIASVSDRTQGEYQVALSSWDGKRTRVVTKSDGTKDSPFFRDGSEILFLRTGIVTGVPRLGGEEEQYIPPREGAAEPEAIRQLGGGGDNVVIGLGTGMPFSAFGLSSGEDYFACVRQTERGAVNYAAEVENGDLAQAGTSQPLQLSLAQAMSMVWSPDSPRYALAYMDRDGTNGLEIVDLEFMNRTSLFDSKETSPAKPAWSPDGSKIAFEMWTVKDGAPEKCQGIYTLDPKGGKPVLVAKGDAREPHWSHGGRYLVYTLAREDGKRDIWRMNADGAEATNLTNGEGDNHYPACSPAPVVK